MPIFLPSKTIIAGSNISVTDTSTSATVSVANVGSPNGIASLDGGGKVPITQLPSAIMEYKGTWDATTNTPTLADGIGDTGDVYRVNVGGTRNLGSGNITFDVGDYVIYNGTIWEKSDTTDAVASVNGLTGIVTLTTANINDSSNRRYITDAQQTVLTNTSGTNSGDQNLFSTIAVTGQSNVVADSLTDTLTLVAGAGMQLTTAAASDNITFTSLARTVLTGARTYFVGFNLGIATMGASSTVTVTNHGLTSAAPIVFSGTTAPTGITFGTVYYANVLTANTFTIYTTPALTTQVTYTGSGTNVIVRTGNDNNIGFGTNGVNTALLTLQKAIDLVAAIDSSIYDVTIQVCDGLHAHTGTIEFKSMGGAGKVIIVGNTTTPANCTFRCLGGASVVHFRSFYLSTVYDLRGFTMENNQASLIGLSVVGGSVLVSFLRIGVGTQPYLFILICQFGGLIDIVNDCTFLSVGSGAICAFDSGSVRLFNPATGLITMLIQNAPSAGTFFRLRNCGIIIIGGVGVVDGNFAGTPPGSPSLLVQGNSVVNGVLFRGLNNLGACTFTIGTPGIVNLNNHGLAANAEVRFTTTGTLANPLLINTSYYVTAANLTINSFAVSATIGGAQIDFTTAGTGVNTLFARQSAFTQTINTGGQVY